MTLTSIIPTLRASIPDPLTTDRWPVATRPTIDDVLVGGISLRHLVALCGTPCVHVADAVRPGARGVPAPGTVTTVLVTTVTSARIVEGGRIELMTDADLDHALWSEARLIGRTSTARAVPAIVTGRTDANHLQIPADIHTGDLLAVPYPGSLSLKDVQMRHGVSPIMAEVFA
ncbi:hypothetical protein SAMN05216410_1120 [Sanguibacter gelidistatuariae]|uniref:Uncharacterized protein n=1 Tax=Sanguibacter gelidistatuariae TaxID=1814289 RepID=A0A1G6HM34_9MICO|nr:hypothetical protein [Sanguibacter gelidistatuariae]SDB94945.1 hypothetical protein SAMN05216410_1120 [Sanguibacter gelidistatuariae]